MPHEDGGVVSFEEANTHALEPVPHRARVKQDAQEKRSLKLRRRFGKALDRAWRAGQMEFVLKKATLPTGEIVRLKITVEKYSRP